MEREEVRTCHTCGGKLISPPEFYTSRAVSWIVSQGWAVERSGGDIKYFCVDCQKKSEREAKVAKEKQIDPILNELEDMKSDASMEDIF